MLGAHMGSEAFYIHRVYLLSGRSKWAMAVFCPLWFYVVGLSVAGVVTWPRWATQFTKVSVNLVVATWSTAGSDVWWAGWRETRAGRCGERSSPFTAMLRATLGWRSESRHHDATLLPTISIRGIQAMTDIQG
jgi:hypothetical protein